MEINELYYKAPPSKLKLKKPYFKGFENLWEQTSLPLGNGSIGMGIMGEVKKDKIILNHKTLWAGGPSPKRPDYCGGNITTPDKNGKLPRDYHKEIYEAFKNGDDKTAHNLCEKLVGISDGYGAYQCWGELELVANDIKKFKNYQRKLYLEYGICEITFDAKLKSGKWTWEKRNYCVSYPDKCATISIIRDCAPIDYTISLSTEHGGKLTYTDDGVIIHYGSLEDNGLNYSLYAKVITDGDIIASNDSLRIKNTKELTIFLSADTDYLDFYPTYRTGESAEELQNRVKNIVDKASEKEYITFAYEHAKDFSSLYNRVSLDLDGNVMGPADQLIHKYEKFDRRSAEQLLYQYGRYLAISSTRETDILPSNLQGIWNVSNDPKWSSDFHTNVNLQMNYWPIFNGNLAECAKPLIRYIKSMVEPGRITAEYYTGIKSEKGEKNGFLFHTQCTPFGWTCPGWQFDWGWSPAAMPWILHNCYEHYEYTLDKETLKNDIYPMLKECAEYFSKLLVEHNGRLVTYPCYSPEHGPRTMGNTYEQALLWQLYDDASKSAIALGIDEDYITKWQDIQSKLKVYEIGDDGQIKEWYHETKLGEIGETHHRHMSHLLGLFPCNVMNKFTNPELIEAAIVSMNHRTDKSTGWSMGQKINTWARVGDGDRVLKIIGDLFKNGIYPNFFDYHPPFQIDGNFGFTSGVNEMLMQSHCGFIELLPALPTDWCKGSIKGLVARGNFTINIEWSCGKLTKAEITSNMGGKCKLYYGKSEYVVENICNSENGFVEFQSEKGKTYTIKIK